MQCTHIHTYCMHCLSAMNCSSLLDSVSAHYYTVQMTTLQQCLKFCCRKLCVPAYVCSVTVLASPVWTVDHASCLPKDALHSSQVCLSLYSVCLYMCLFVYAHSYRKMMECWHILNLMKGHFSSNWSGLDQLHWWSINLMNASHSPKLMKTNCHAIYTSKEKVKVKTYMKKLYDCICGMSRYIYIYIYVLYIA